MPAIGFGPRTTTPRFPGPLRCGRAYSSCASRKEGHSMKQQANRRDFLKTAAGAVAVPYLIPGAALGADGREAPSNRIVMGGIGIGNQGSGDQGAFVGRGDVQYVAACDVNEQHLEAALGRANQRYRNRDCKPF